jgi:hypothetical protein
MHALRLDCAKHFLPGEATVPGCLARHATGVRPVVKWILAPQPGAIALAHDRALIDRASAYGFTALQDVDGRATAAKAAQ